MSKLFELAEQGQAVWFDYFSRSFLASGGLAALVEKGIRGVTSNPAIFKNAIADSDDYDKDLAALAAAGLGAEAIYEALAIDDIRSAAKVLRPVYDKTNAADGYVSLEVNPRLAFDTGATVAEAVRLHKAIGHPNVMIKVPATPAGIPAIESLTAWGISINATLVFSLAQYEAVAHAYLAGLERLLDGGGDPSKVASVASFFVSRVDVATDKLLQKRGEHALLGKIAVDNARLAYARFEELFSGARWQKLAAVGAQLQRPLWASTGTKNPDYSDLLYVNTLVGPHTVNTLPPATLDAALDHATVACTVRDDIEGARRRFARLAEVGIDIGAITDKLLEEGVKSFADAFDALVASVALKRRSFAPATVSLEASLGEIEAPAAACVERLISHLVVSRIWEHDHTLWSQLPVEIEDRLAWLRVAGQMSSQLPRLTALRDRLVAEGFKDAILMGMGGSSLAPEVLAKVFTPAHSASDGLALTILDTTVPGAILEAAQRLDPRTTVYLVSTKSGSTVETLSLFKYFYNRVSAELGSSVAAARFIAITDPGSSLEASAKELGIAEIFLNEPNLGGRYSALSLVGLLPAALIGVNVEKLLASARFAMADAQPDTQPGTLSGESALEGNPAARLGAIMAAAALGGRDKLTIVSSPVLSSLGDWIEQLVAESTGKEGRGILPVVGEALGAPTLYGDDRLFVCVTLEGEEDAQTRQKLEALVRAGHPVVRLGLPTLSDLGAQFFIWEFATAVAGWFLEIHPFNQPDVELAKTGTRAVVEQYKATGTLQVDSPQAVVGEMEVYGDVVDCSGLSEALESFLDGVGPGDYVALQAYVAKNESVDEALALLREAIRGRTRAAVTVGYGPRFLHSTGQLHKGDGGRGRFVQLTAEDAVEVPIPDELGGQGSSLGFGVLKLAQALGDADALERAGRKVVRFHTKGSAVKMILQLAGR
jgi:transaldolase/glucose-6-phosphate isomerase